MPAPNPEIVLNALARGVTGDEPGGLKLLEPIVAQGPAPTYVLLATLAEAALFPHRKGLYPEAPSTFEVIGPDGSPDMELLPSHLKFGARFIAAWAARDQDAASALFRKVIEEPVTEGGDGTIAVFMFAVSAAKHVVHERRRLDAEGSTP
ncbi:hypothetical protein ACFWVB_02600 [Streptomyces microflavus]|uniref:hypothetical protein n=1 Tax=Streptomyces microflavus TaxID=1919 RepID=UPI0036539FB6